jgi:hypothetical protein
MNLLSLVITTKRILTVSTLEKRAIRNKVFKSKKEKYQETKTIMRTYVIYIYSSSGVIGVNQIKEGKMDNSHNTHGRGKKSMQSFV